MASKTLQANFVTPEQVAAGIKDGSIQVVHDIELPDLDRVKGY